MRYDPKPPDLLFHLISSKLLPVSDPNRRMGQMPEDIRELRVHQRDFLGLWVQICGLDEITRKLFVRNGSEHGRENYCK